MTLETTTRSCKGCANFQWAADSPSARAAYKVYLDAKAEYDRWQEAEDSKGFWATLLSFGSPMYLRPMPPYPRLDPANYGWCLLNPKTVEKNVNSWCSHFSPSHNGEGE